MIELVAHDAWAKLALMIGLLLALGIWQGLRPARGDASPLRWRRNLGLIAVSTLASRLVVPASGAAAAFWAGANGIGLFNALSLPFWLAFGATLVVMDFAIYWQHRAFHRFPLLWRAHRVHHSDPGFDVTLGLRFHPFEIVPSAAFKLGVVVALGAPPSAVVVYELMLLGMSLFTHADLRLPGRVESLLRLVLVTPDWHRVHHAVDRDERDTNYGNILTAWDRLFGTAREQPHAGHETMAIGLAGYSRPERQTLWRLLTQPFLSRPFNVDKAEVPHA
jgi:sterol desaturase/sphingolipid hydroxylase (fatty acid hydroxylase superfamily)